MPTLESRATVGLAAPDSRPRFPGPKLGVTAHWNGPAMRLGGRPHSECRARWRGVQNYHMKSKASGGNDWADVAYTAAVCHHEIVMEGRGPGVRTAANGTTSGNNSWYAIFFMVGGAEQPSTEMLVAAEWYARVHLGTTNWNRHKDHKPTTCAGTVNPYISGGSINVGTFELGDRLLSLKDPMMRGDDVREWQQLSNTHGMKLSTDGVFGPATETGTKQVQAVLGVTPDGIVGPKTLAAARSESDDIAEPDEPDGPFPDVPVNGTHTESIERAHALGLLSGKADGTFDPRGNVTREQLASALVNLYDAVK